MIAPPTPDARRCASNAPAMAGRSGQDAPAPQFGRATSHGAEGCAPGRDGAPAPPARAIHLQGDTRPADPPRAAEAAVEDGGRSLRLWRRDLTLMSQFAIVSSCVLLLGMLVQGAWMTATIEDKAKYHAGAAAALFVEHIIAPHFRSAQPGEPLSAGQRDAVDTLVQQASERMQIAALKIWSPRGTILYSTNSEVVGLSFEPTDAFRGALAGVTTVEFDVLDEDESLWERSLGIPLIEVYVPIYNAAREVVAVAEFYENAEVLNRELIRSRRDTWLVTGAVFLAMILALLSIVTRGSEVIEQQRHSLTEKVRELSRLLDRNSLLQDRAERASRLAAEESEQFLLRLGADLHDGPAQLIGIALLRLDLLAARLEDPALRSCAATTIASIQAALFDAMNDVRSVCAGLSMPSITNLAFAEAITLVVREHERHTGTTVAIRLGQLPTDPPHFVKTSLCRLVQEGLNNAFRHANGRGQSVTARSDGAEVVVEIADTGPGMARPACTEPRNGLGLRGIANRIESLGGTMRVESVPGHGTRLTATMPVVRHEGRTAP